MVRPKKQKPNIVLFFSDDQGYQDVGFHGSRDIRTPHIDSIAQGGTRFTDGYVSAPLCSPSRAGLLTGRYQQRFGHEHNTGKPKRQLKQDIGLPLTETTLAKVLQGAGYKTGIMGKWHQGMKPKYHPLERGFDEFFGFLHGGHGYLDLAPDGPNPIYRGTTPVADKDYLTDAISREASSFVERHRDRPFFLYVAYNAPHKPFQAPKKYLRRFGEIGDEKRRAYAAMISAMDDGVGRVVAAVKKAGLEENTIFLFLTDNGGAKTAPSSNGPLRGHKYSLFEGGIRVPWTMKWKGRIPAGKTYREPVISLDIFATAAAAAGAKLPKGRQIDGVDLLPYLDGSKAGQPHDALYWRWGKELAVRKGDFKLHRDETGQAELFDLAKDEGEQTNLAGKQPQVRAELAKLLEQWNAQLVEPLWTKRKSKG